LTKNGFGRHFEQTINKLIWSPWSAIKGSFSELSLFNRAEKSNLLKNRRRQHSVDEPQIRVTSYDHNFCQFLAKKLAFFAKTNVMITFLKKLAVVRAKNANIFATFFRGNIFKIITSVPDEFL
jgi:hypothetical protein